MSASTQTGEQTNTNGGTPARRKRGPNKKTAARKVVAKKPAAPVASITPTPERQIAMNQRTAGVAASSIASGFASTLLTAGPNWTAEYQKTFMASLTAALPLICAAPIAKAA